LARREALDAIGSIAYNQQLSEARAATVKNWLVAHNFVSSSTPIKGYGKTRPIDPTKPQRQR
jgi:outer membrane protein OmpA-like peptidoglycan-associated protein